MLFESKANQCKGKKPAGPSHLLGQKMLLSLLHQELLLLLLHEQVLLLLLPLLLLVHQHLVLLHRCRLLLIADIGWVAVVTCHGDIGSLGTQARARDRNRNARNVSRRGLILQDKVKQNEVSPPEFRNCMLLHK